MIKFETINYCRTFVEIFWSVRVDRKKKSHYDSRVSLHEAPTKNRQNFFGIKLTIPDASNYEVHVNVAIVIQKVESCQENDVNEHYESRKNDEHVIQMIRLVFLCKVCEYDPVRFLFLYSQQILLEAIIKIIIVIIVIVFIGEKQNTVWTGLFYRKRCLFRSFLLGFWYALEF